MKKTFMKIAAVLCAAASLPFVNVPYTTLTDSGTAVVASAADAIGGIYEGSYNYEYADTSVYTTSIKPYKVTVKDDNGQNTDISQWEGKNGNTYSIYEIKVTSKEDGKLVTNLLEYRIAMVKAKTTALDVVMSEKISIPDSLAAELSAKDIIVNDSRASVIADSAFAESYLKTIDLSGVEYIGAKAFSKCSYITEITLPDSVRFVGANAFENSGLKTLNVNMEMPVIPASLCANTNLTNITFSHPEYIREIGEAAFKNTPVGAPFFEEWSNVDSYEFLKIDNNAFENCSSIKNVTIPDNVYMIGQSAFKNCTSMGKLVFGTSVLGADKESFSGCSALSEVVFNSDLDTLGGGAFQGCTSLKDISGLPETLHDWIAVTSTTGTGMGDGVFQGCTSLESADLPKSLTIIPQNTFNGCKALNTVGNYGEIVTIGKGAFQNCSNLFEAVYEKASNIGESAFANCTSMHTLRLPSADIIGKAAFENCSKLETFEVGSCTSVGDDAMKGCTSIKNITLLSDIYGKYVFQNCTSAETISIKTDNMDQTPVGMFSGCTSLKKIDADISKITIAGKETFANCTSLEAINLPSLRIIEQSAFMNCTNLKKIADGANAIKAEDYGDNCFKNCSSLSVVVEGSISTIGANAFSGSGINRISIEGMTGGTVVIGASAFSECPALTSATILSEKAAEFSVGAGIFKGCDALVSAVYEGPIITANMFKDCTALKDVETNAEVINSSAFENCTSLTMVSERGSSNKSTIIAKAIDNAAFKNCASLSVVPFDKSTVFTGNSQFTGCISIKSANVGSTLTANMFSGCTSLSDVNINGITDIPNAAFKDCIKLENIDISGVVTVGSEAFAGSGLSSVKINNAQTIGSSAFKNCNNITSIDVGAKEIKKSAFEGCQFLETAKVYVESIGELAFNNCASLRDVIIQSNDSRKLQSIGASAFNNCNVLYEVVVPNSPTIGTNAFGKVNNKLNDYFLLVGEKDSSVSTYAEKNKIAFQDINTYDAAERNNGRTTPGDVDGNTIVSAADAVKLQSWLLGKATPGIVGANMDINKDKRVDAYDLVLLRKILTSGK